MWKGIFVYTKEPETIKPPHAIFKIPDPSIKIAYKTNSV